jgi:hypothetical protein
MSSLERNRDSENMDNNGSNNLDLNLMDFFEVRECSDASIARTSSLHLTSFRRASKCP